MRWEISRAATTFPLPPVPQVNPPLKRRAIGVCPFKGAFDNSLAFQGWDEKIHINSIAS